MKQDIRNSSEVKVNLGGDRKEEIGQNKKIKKWCRQCRESL